MASRVFVSYRRAESLKDAQHLATLLGNAFGRKKVFIDTRGIEAGSQWVHELESQVDACDAMVALIGPHWLDAQDEDGNRRLDNPNDFVRFEISRALQRGIPVLPVLLDDAQMPKASDLPNHLAPLQLYQASILRSESFVSDAEAIAGRLKILRSARRGISVGRASAAIVAAIVGSAAVTAFALSQFGPFTRANGLVVRTLNEQVQELKQALTAADARAAVRVPQFRPIDHSGPWGIAWKWQTPNCRGGFNLLVSETGSITVYGKGGLIKGGSGDVLRNGRFYTTFPIENGKYTFRGEGSIASMNGEGELALAIDDPDQEPYCRGVFVITRGSLPPQALGNGNGN